MARARNIKPGFFKNEILGVADPLYSLLFEGLWVLADRAGRLEDRPLRIKAEIFPYRDGLDLNGMLDWLATNGFIRRYASEGKKCILVLEFVKHQNPHKNETDSELPAPGIEVTTSEVIGTTSEKIGSTRADSLSTDSLSTDSLIAGNPSADALPPAKPGKAAAVIKPEDVDTQVWSDWMALRKAKKAPVTETVLAAAISEAEKANLTTEDFLRIWCLRGSQGLQADWIKPEERKQAARPTPQSFAERDAAAGRKRWEQMTGRRHPDSAPQETGNFIDAPRSILEIES